MLFLIVGPSGVGKDSLIDGAKTALTNDPAFVFPARLITRPFDAGGEQHIELSRADFETARATGQFALHWQAHGLYYGIDQAIVADLAAGRHVTINVSRGVLDQARTQFQKVCIISISAPSTVITQRLRARGRESEADIADRVARTQSHQVRGSDVIELINDGELSHAIAKMVAILRHFSADALQH